MDVASPPTTVPRRGLLGPIGRPHPPAVAPSHTEHRSSTGIGSSTAFELSTRCFKRSSSALISPNPLLESLPCAKERGRLLVAESLELPDWPGVWALGDCAAIPDRQTGKFHPPTAQHAFRQAKIVAHNVTAFVKGTKKKGFNFSTVAQLAAIGQRTGVANILGMNFSGFVAWWLWRTIYLSKLPRFEKKLRVAFDWTLDLIFSKDLVQFLDIRAPMVSHPEGLSSMQTGAVAVGEGENETVNHGASIRSL
jgi:hypothetical protein